VKRTADVTGSARKANRFYRPFPGLSDFIPGRDPSTEVLGYFQDVRFADEAARPLVT
jgi:hypothetical protein